MGGILQALIGAVSGIVRSISAWDVVGDDVPGNSAIATFSVNSDGSISGLGALNNLTTSGGNAWYRPNIVGIGSNYWVRFTPTAGTLSTNGAATFTQLNANRSVTKQGSTGAASCTFTIEIATDAAGTNIVLTSTGHVVRYTHT